jgi:hypothetical protein
MTTTLTSFILLGEPSAHIQVEELEPSPSPYTGRDLRRVSFTVTVQGEEEHERLNAELTASRNGTTFIADTSENRWKVDHNNFSYQSGQSSTRFTHDVVLDEHEELALDRVKFEGIELAPDRWVLDSSPGDITMLRILADFNSEQHRLFEQILEQRRTASGQDHYFPVTWVGITETPMSMRFGQCLWQPLDNDAARHVIVLVSEQNDSNRKNRGLLAPESARVKEQSVAAKTKLDALIDELHGTGVLSTDAVNRINSAAAAPPFSAWRVFEQTDDVEDYFD